MPPAQVQLYKPVLSQARPQLQAHSATANVVQDQVVRQEQSLGMIKCLLGASLGSLSFLRGLLPDECFKDTRYGGSQPTLMNYPSFTRDENEDEPDSMKVGSGIRVKRLRRGYSDEADRLLDWLERGVFDALSKNYLKGFQVAIYLNRDKPALITESYTFSFSYDMNDDGTPSLPRSLHVRDNAGREITVTDARRSFQQVARRLVMITQNLPPLPDERYLTMRLYYNDWTPHSYSPPYFRRLRSNDSRLRLQPERDFEEVTSENCGAVSTGYHAVSVRVSALIDTPQPESKRPRLRLHMPEDDVLVPSLEVSSAQHSIASREPSRILEKTRHITNDKAQPTSALHKHKPRTDINEIQTRTIELPSVRNRKELSPREEKVRAALHRMLHPNSPIDLVETQVDMSQSHFSEHQDSENNIFIQRESAPNIYSVEESSSSTSFTVDQHVSANYISEKKSNPQGKSNEQIESTTIGINNNAAVTKLALSSTKLKELKRRKQRNSKERNGNRNEQEHAEVVTCECGDSEDELGMIACDICNGWLHAHCYGYHTTDDSRIPDNIACYSCLLDKEATLLAEMKDLTIYRRAVKKVWDDGYPKSNRLLAESLGCGLPTALEITRRLENEGFIVSSLEPRGRARPRRAAMPIKYKVVKTEENRLKMDRNYFDPLAKISHHFELPPTTESLLVPDSMSYRQPSGYSTSVCMQEISANTTKTGNSWNQNENLIVTDSHDEGGFDNSDLDLDLDATSHNSSKSSPVRNRKERNASMNTNNTTEEQYAWYAKVGTVMENLNVSTMNLQ